MKMQPGDIVSARFAPVRTDDLVPEAIPLVGTTRRFVATWIVDEGIGSPYEGQWRMALVDRIPGLRWVPECDLADVEHVGVDPEYDFTRKLMAGYFD